MDNELFYGGQWTDGEEINMTIAHFNEVLCFSAIQHNDDWQKIWGSERGNDIHTNVC